MRTGKLIAAAGTALALTIGVIPAAAAKPGATSAPADPLTSVTLITGDRVLITAHETYAVKPAAGREKMTFSGYRTGDHFYVVPSDAAGLIATDRLDRNLFDVTELIRSGFDDRGRGTLPVIVTYQGAVHANLAGATGTRELRSINGTALAADKGSADLWKSITTPSIAATGIKKVWLDRKRQASLDRSVPQIGAPAAWAAGFTGAGETIAVLDTGVDQTHPDLATQEIAERNFSDAADNVDRFGHGTHVASTAAGTGAKAAGKYKGVAFGAKVLDGKVLNDQGGGLDSWIIAGMEWAADQGATVANLSLGGGDGPETDPLEEAVNTLSARTGILFVIAAGNSGGPETIGSPGSADAALTVGAVDRDDDIAPFSSRGPRTGDGAVKPDITAPGVEIVAARAANGMIGTPAADGYVALSGTSMATPHVAGSAAILAQQHPSWTGAQLKTVLTASARPNPALGAFDQGSGRVDVAKAITQSVTTEPTSVSLGTQQWPHNDDQAVSKPLTYRNSGSTDVTLTLAVESSGPGGQPVPSGVFSLSTNQITVPAGGTAQVDLTADVRTTPVDGVYSGSIVATAAGTSVRTPFAITREVESYNLTIDTCGADGAPTDQYSIALIGFDDDRLRFFSDPDGSVTTRLPKGRYFIDDVIGSTDAGGAPHTNLVAAPNTVVTADSTITMRARDAKPISVRPPDSAATLAIADLGYDIRTAHGRLISFFVTTELGAVSIGRVGPALPPEMLTTRINTQWSTPRGDFYGLAWFFRGTVPNGLDRAPRMRDLATVNSEWTGNPDRTGARLATPAPTTEESLAFAAALDVPLPGKRTEFYNTDGTQWSTELLQTADDPFSPELDLFSPYRTFKSGHTYRERFGHGMFGPAFPALPAGASWAGRFGDVIAIRVPMFGDSSGNGGFSVTESAGSKLFRDGELVSESAFPGDAFAEVPAAPANYRLTTEVTRDGAFDVSTRIGATCTFRSGHAPDDGEALPLNAVRFTPRLDDANSAPAGRPFLVPVALQRQSGTTVRPHRLTVGVSYDEGKTWQMADVSWNLLVRLNHPATATSVSLRAKASDRDGNTVEQTVINAYKLR